MALFNESRFIVERIAAGEIPNFLLRSSIKLKRQTDGEREVESDTNT